MATPCVSFSDGEFDTDLNGEIEEMRSKSATPTSPKPSSNRSKKSKSSSKRRNSGDSTNVIEPIVVHIEPKNIIDEEIEALRKQLTRIDKVALSQWQKTIEDETIACTCVLIETENELCENEMESKEQLNLATTNVKSENMQIELPMNSNSIESNVPKMLNENSVLPVNKTDSTPSANLSASIDPSKLVSATHSTSTINPSSGNQREPVSKEQPIKKPTVKSIFDLDYEEDDDPITFRINHNNNDMSLLINNYDISNKPSSVLNNNNKDNSNNDISNDKNKQNCDEVKFAKEATTNTIFSNIPLESTESTTNKKNIVPPTGSDQSNVNDVNIDGDGDVDDDDDDDDSEFMAVPTDNATSSNW